jgi:DNA-binding NarL/FixJ family response regulator
MRVIVVGTLGERAKIRKRLDSSLDVVAEFDTLAEARSSGIAADAVLTAAGPVARPGDPERPAAEPLTPREREVLELLAEGLPNKAIAAELGISDQTVKFHVASISAKLGAANRTEAVRLALRRGLVTL